MTVQASVNVNTIQTRADRQPLPYELRIQEKLAQVQALVNFVEQEHFTLNTLYAYLKQDKRAVLGVRNMARILGYPLDENINETHYLLQESQASDLYDFTENFAPHLFGIVDQIGTNREYISDMRTHVEEIQYATEIRRALLQHLLMTYNARYQRSSLFGNLLEASRWTAMYSRNLDTADDIIRNTRDLLRAQKDAATDYLKFIANDIKEIQELAEARYRVVKPIGWMQAIESAEHRIVNILGERSQAYETLNLSALTPQQRNNRLSGMAKHLLKRAPRLAFFLIGLASAGIGALTFFRPQVAPATAKPLPEPVRGTTSSADTARFSAINTGDLRARSSQIVQDLVSDFFTAVQPSPSVSVEQQKVTNFFASLPAKNGKQTLVLDNATELRAFVDYLTAQNYYSESEVLTLFNLNSVQALTHRLVIDVRYNPVKPALFPYNEADSNVTAVMSTVPSATTNAVGQLAANSITAAFSDVNNTAAMNTLQPNEAYIIYRVQPNDTLDSIATRYGLAVDQIQADNHLTTAAVTKGQVIQIRRPAMAQSSNRTFSFTLFGASNTKAQDISTVVPKSTSIGNHVVQQYYNQLFPSLEAMPEDARTYVVNTVEEVATFFNVRPQDILGIMKQEQNNAGFRLYEDRISVAGAVGIGQIVPQTWNGWSGGNSNNFSRSMAEIEQDGGIGFDWAARETWQKVEQGALPMSVLTSTNADPNVFENSVAAIARHLTHYGLTAEFAQVQPQTFTSRLADAIAIYNSGRPLSVSGDWTQSADNQKTTANYVAQAMATADSVASAFAQIATTAPTPNVTMPTVSLEQRYGRQFRELFDQDFGLQLSDAELQGFLAANQTLLDDVRQGKVDPIAAGIQLMGQVEMHYQREGREAMQNGDVRPWPYIHNGETLEAQRLASSMMGRTLTMTEIDGLVVSTNANVDEMRSALAARPEASLFVQAQQTYDNLMQRSSRGLRVYNHEVATIIQPLLAGYNTQTLDDTTLRMLGGKIETAVRGLSEYQTLHGVTQFKSYPFLPMPEVFKGFGVPVTYQAGGVHTGIDVTAPKVNGQEPTIYAVYAGTVVHVGSLYCDQADACRGGNAIVIDHGNNVYSLYSHNSEADVKEGERVEAGQVIGRQGNEGYSFGDHLHFEVHTGATYSGNWEQPFNGGSFVDPMQFLPK